MWCWLLLASLWLWLCLAVAGPLVSGFYLTEVSERAGLEATGHGYGLCFSDYDRDGDPDICLFSDRAYLYRNNGGSSFDEIGVWAGLGGTNSTYGGVFGDYDNDGYPDLIILSPIRETSERERWVGAQFFLYHNNGDGTFSNMTKEAGLPRRPGYETATAFLDYDNDGYLDIYSAGIRLSPWRSGGVTLESVHSLYHNNGDGSFTNLTDEAGLGESFYARSISTGDLDGNGYTDILVMSELSRIWHLFMNNGNGTFTPIDTNGSMGFATLTGWDEVPVFSGGFLDVNNDGRIDIFLNNGQCSDNPQPNSLYLNAGDGMFRDMAEEAGVANPDQPGRGVAFGDFDNNGFIDLFVTGTGYGGWARVQPHNTLFLNNGNLTFKALTQEAGVLPGGWDWAAAALDYDKDGYLDICLNGDESYQETLYKNPGNANNWLGIDLIGTMSNRDGIGARIQIEHNGISQLRDYASGGGAFCPNHGPIHFGLGEASIVGRMTITWPSGLVQELHSIPANRVLTVIEGEGGEMDWTRAYTGTSHVPIQASFEPGKVLGDGMAETRLTVQAFPVPNMPGRVSRVIADLTPIGRDPESLLLDDGAGSDLVAGDGIYTLTTSIDPSAGNGHHMIRIVLVDESGKQRSTFATLGVVPGHDYYIFSDEINPQWRIETRLADLCSSPDDPYQGSAAQRLDLEAGGWVTYQWTHPDCLETYGFGSLHFLLKPIGGGLDPSGLVLLASGLGGQRAISLEAADKAPREDGWTQVRVSLETLGLADNTLESLRLFARKDTSILLDEIRLESMIPERGLFLIILSLALLAYLSHTAILDRSSPHKDHAMPVIDTTRSERTILPRRPQCGYVALLLTPVVILPVVSGMNLSLKWEFTPGEYYQDKSFSPGRIFPPTVLDIDQDGEMEVLWGTARGDSKRIWCISSKGELEWVYPPIEEEGLPGESSLFRTKISFFDLDGDGGMELGFFDQSGALRVLNASGRLVWMWGTPGECGVVGSPQVVDVDADGHPEIFVRDTCGSIYRLDHGGQVVWSCDTDWHTSEGQVTLADIDRDGAWEMVYVGLNRLCCHDTKDGYVEWVYDIESTWHPNDVFIADIDGDGEYEAVVWDTEGSVFSVSYYGSREWRWDPEGGEARMRYCQALGDIDGDGGLEMVFTTYNGINCLDISGQEPRLRWCVNLTGLSEEGVIPPHARTGQDPAYILIADLDGDGSMDILLLAPYPIVLGPYGGIQAYYLEDDDFPGFRAESGAWWGDLDGDGRSEWLCDLQTVFDEAKLSCLTANGPYPASAAWPEYYHSALPPEYQKDQRLSLISAYSNSLWFPLNEQAENHHITILLLLVPFSLWTRRQHPILPRFLIHPPDRIDEVVEG